MDDAERIAGQVEAAFDWILREKMQGIPIVNPAIRVETLGFQEYEGRVFGIVVTPWLMNLVLLPAADEDWSGFELGDKKWHRIGPRQYKFLVNDIDGIGRCQTHSLYSPMREFRSHEQARNAALQFLDDLMRERETDAEDPVDEELLGRVLRGEATAEIPLAEIETAVPERAGAMPARGAPQNGVKVQRQVSRRNLLRGRIG